MRGLGETRRHAARAVRRRTQFGLLHGGIQTGTAPRRWRPACPRSAPAVTCLPLLRRRRHLIRAEIDPHLVRTEAHAIFGQKGRPPHPLALDLRAIRRGQVADHQQPVGLHQQAMPLRQTRMLDHHVAVFMTAQNRDVPHDRNRWITILGNQFRFHRSYSTLSGKTLAGWPPNLAIWLTLYPNVSLRYGVIHETKAGGRRPSEASCDRGTDHDYIT